MTTADNILEVQNLSVHFGHGDETVKAVDDVSFVVGHGETLALVGESGSGKSISALSITKLTPRAARFEGGQVMFGGQNMLSLSDRELRGIRGSQISYIFQEPMVSFNPVYTIGWQIEEALKLHRKGIDRKVEISHLLDLVYLPDRLATAYPHQMSGGQLQRCMIAMALACSPELLVADEPTTALDVTVQREILNLLAELSKKVNLSVLMITHNFGIVSDLADHVCVMKKGKIVEEGQTRQVLDDPQHDYTKQLMAAVPRLHPAKGGGVSPMK
ncbi:ATP-binding cassette domain-containing protein [Pontiella sulfatireligans]|uniref:Oligopeptide transport ATP-binding protein OppD n=1 Tax=Pontiella sulfatireligans TaxID=2750658 RepID=A0A6C2URK6_9BACT|nr:ABC transporter ATP-binding protein [Pontiella sulfatireligans]VGO22935.1 Oligopeptide transport ATP-binding protein OppD [Pontiella sulfatireligans]